MNVWIALVLFAIMGAILVVAIGQLVGFIRDALTPKDGKDDE